MVKPFFFGIGVFIRAVVSTSAALFTPLLAGVDRNLGGSPRLPFRSPLAQPAVDAVHSRLARVKSSVSRPPCLGSWRSCSCPPWGRRWLSA